MKIRTIIFGVYVAVSAVAFSGVVALVLREVRLRYVESMRRTLGDTAAFLGAFVGPVAQRTDDWPQKLGELPQGADLIRVFACDRDGRVRFDSTGTHDGQVYAFPMRGGGRAASENYTLSNVAEVDGELRVAAPVRRGPELIGWVGVGRRLASISEGVEQARKELLWSLGLIAAGMVGVGWWIASKLTHSVERLTAYAVAVRDGRSARPPTSRATEVAELGRAFEEMRVALDGKAYVERYTQALAHELKAPLTSLRGAAELLAEDPPEPDRARFIGNIRAEVARLQRVVDRLLELAALEAQRPRRTDAEIDLSDLVRSRGEAARPMAALRGVTVTFPAADSAAGRVRGDAPLLAQAIDNLLQNAIEFSPAGTDVAIAVRSGDGACQVTVDDHGPGVPDYAREQVFERFYSLPRPDTGRKSSGLGLSIVREIARLHGGEARLENRAGGGARAVLRLPAG